MSVFGSMEFRVPRLKPISPKRSSVVTVLDIGSSKVVCMIGRLEPYEDGHLLRGRSHRIEIVGIGHQKSVGMKNGVIADLDAMEKAIRLAVDAAERMAGLTVDSLIVNVTAGRLTSTLCSAAIHLGGHEVETADLKRVLAAAGAQSVTPDRTVLHSLTTGFSLDGDHGVSHPLGMYGDELAVDMHILTAERAPLKNLELCINRAHLSVEGMVATPYASGLASLVDDELEMGCAAVDLGAGTTTISVFADGRFVHADAIALGGHHVTTDLARGLGTRIDDAERLKVVHGSALPVATDDREVISIPSLGQDEREPPAQVPRALVARIIRARVEETLELIRDRIQQSGYGPVVGRRLVLTGGASQLTGLVEVARRILARNVRIGRPLGVSGLPPAAKGPAFSTALGLMIYPQVVGLEADVRAHEFGAGLHNAAGRLVRMGQWFRQSF